MRCLAIVLCFASRSWQIALELLHHGCDLNVRICAKHCFFRSTDVPLRRKVGSRARRLRASSHRFAAESGSNCARNVTEGSRLLFLFFVDAVLLCFACVKSLCAVELVHQGDVFYSSLFAILLCCAIQSVQITMEWLCKASRRALVLQ